MTTQTKDQLINNVLIGRIEKHGSAWWNTTGTNGVTADGVSNHREGFLDGHEVAARLFNWEAEYAPVLYLTGETETVYVPTDGFPTQVERPIVALDTARHYVQRSDTRTRFTIVSNRHGLHQYDEVLLGNVAAILDQSVGDLGIASAGLLDDGAIAWVQVEPTEGIEIGGDKLYPFLCAYSSHDGTYATQYRRGFTRTVCDNTLAAFNAEGGAAVKVRHTRNSKLDVSNARRVLDVTFAGIAAFEEEVARLQDITVTDATFEAIMAQAFPKPEGEDVSASKLTRWANRTTAISNLYKSDPRVKPWAGTVWGVVQAVNTFNTWEGNVKTGATRFDRVRSSFLAGRVDKADAAIVKVATEVALDRRVLVG